MNSLWPAASRLSCLNSRTIFQTCYKMNCLAARLGQESIRPYAIHTLLFRRRDSGLQDQGPFARDLQLSNLSCKLPHATRTYASRRIIRSYEELPKDYKDEDGLSYRAKPLSQEETEAIFGKVIDAKSADRLLRILHGRRVAGTLGDQAYSSTYEQLVVEDAIQWLRNNVPVDEIECAGLRAEEELAALEADVVSDAQRIGLYKPNSGPRTNVYGDSVIDRVRKATEEAQDLKEAEEKKQLSQADEIRQNTGTLQTLSPKSKVELRRPGENPRLKKYLERAKVLPDTPPALSKFQRLGPSGVAVLAIILGCCIFVSVYTPPRKEWRMWPDMPPSAATIISIIILNSVILGAWRVPAAFRLLNKYFITVPGYPRAASVIGNVFSHQTVSHFALNMVVLWFVGTRLHEEVGRANFLAIYMCCGAFGSFASLASWVLRNNFVSSSLGASGALSGIIATYLLLNSNEKVTFFGVFPPENWPSISAISFLLFLIGMDVLGLAKGNKMVTIDHWAHLGGYAAGMASAGVLGLRASQRKEREMERRRNLGVVDRIKEGRL